ncbi:hypothetical protein QUB70_12255 [Microcoleus sp. A003_D6]|uniref:hypothetical protein n=1 Tax=Microcoleus sp. A003_D6 TaxID=3055266 RepID=UPI002FD2E6E6
MLLAYVSIVEILAIRSWALEVLSVSGVAIVKLFVATHILQHSQEQAFRPVPQKINFLATQARKPVRKRLIENGAISQ